MAYRNKVFVSFDGDKDIHYYRLMLAWKQNDRSNFSFNDAHDINTARDTSLESSIKSQLNVRLGSSKVFILLVGESTKYLYKFVRWEIEQAIKLNLPIIVVNLNGKRSIDYQRCPSLLQHELVMHVSFGSGILQHSLENWPDQHYDLMAKHERGPYYFNESIYSRVGA